MKNLGRPNQAQQHQKHVQRQLQQQREAMQRMHESGQRLRDLQQRQREQQQFWQRQRAMGAYAEQQKRRRRPPEPGQRPRPSVAPERQVQGPARRPYQQHYAEPSGVERGLGLLVKLAVAGGLVYVLVSVLA